MSMESLKKFAAWTWLPALIVAWPTLASAQVPVTDSGTPVATVETNAEEIPLLSTSDLEILVGPVALYPDDLLAIVLPASTYPLQLVQAERFLQDLKNDPELEPDESWDDSIVALINYPEVVELLSKDLDKTWRLGEAVVAQQSDVIAAIESFRDQAYAAGNLQTDTYQTVSQNDGVIEITPVEDDVIYVPYYEPESVVVYQSTPAYYYYPQAYPVYNYPYAYGHSFSHGFFWGVTTAFTVGWFSDSLHVYHHSYYGHPYYGHSYGHNYWYRQPSIYAHNNYYYNSHNSYSSGDRYGHGDYWQPHSRSTVSSHDQRVTRSRHYSGTRSGSGSVGNVSAASDVRFRQRTATISNQSSSIKPTQTRNTETRKTKKSQFASRESVSGSAIAKQERSDIKFRERTTTAPQQLAANKSSQPSRSSQSSRSSSQPARSSSQPQRSSQPSRSSSQPPRSSQPSRSSSQPPRSSQPSRSSSQPSRSSQSQKSQKSQKSQQSRSSNSGSNKVASASGGRSEKRSENRR